MRLTKRAVMSGLAAFGFAVCSAASGGATQKVVNDPGSFWSVWGKAKTNYVSAPKLSGGAAQRVTISPKPDNPWDAGTYAGITKPVQKGDVLVLSFWARAEKPPVGSDLIMVTGRVYEAGSSGKAISPEATFLIGRQWKLYYVAGTATKDYPPGTLSAGMILGTGDQTIDFGPVSVLDFGPNFDPSDLPGS